MIAQEDIHVYVFYILMEILVSSEAAKQLFLTHSLPWKILPDMSTSSVFATVIPPPPHGKVVNLASSLQPGGSGHEIYVPPVAQLYPRRRVPFSWPPTTLKPTVEVF
jgi:hypothetical protein